jgi:two-component system, chemotaxis family, protein-glutamate methylesterase/glutaminase
VRRFALVVVGCSWGGLEACGRLMAGLPGDFELPVAIAQHRGAAPGSGDFGAALERRSGRQVREPDDKEPLWPRCVYLAPPDYHLLVEPGGLALSTDAPVRYSRPSVDVLFDSAADAYGARVIGVVLTGANDDGAAGLARIRARGGIGIVQDPAGAARPEMPSAAIAAGGASEVLPLERIGPRLGALCATAGPRRERGAG